MCNLLRIGVFGAGVLLALLCLNSCSLFSPSAPSELPTLSVSAEPSSGHPPFTVDIEAQSSAKGGTYTLEVTGSPALQSTDGAFSVVVDTAPWAAQVKWTDGGSVYLSAAVPVTVENARPVGHDLWAVPNTFKDGDLVLMDMRYLAHGCDKPGTPLTYTGFEDPDYTGSGYSTENDGFTYNVRVQDVATGDWETVWTGPLREEVGTDSFAGPIFYWCVSRTDPLPPFPYTPWSPSGSSLAPMSVGDELLAPEVCCPTPVEPDPSAPGTIEKHIEITVCEFGTCYRFVYSILAREEVCASE